MAKQWNREFCLAEVKNNSTDQLKQQPLPEIP